MSILSKLMRKTCKAYEEGMAAFNRGQFARAAELLARAGGGNGLKQQLARFYAAQARFRLGIEALTTGHYPEATGHFQASARFAPGVVALSRYLVVCYVGQGQYTEAATVLETLLERDDDEVGVRVRLALMYWKKGQGDRAIGCRADGLRSDPNAFALHYHLGTMQAATEAFDRARASFARAVEIEPTCAEAHLRLAWCHAAGGEYDLALTHIQEAHSLRPTDADIAMQLSLAASAAADQGRTPNLRLEMPVADLSRDDAAVAQLADIVARDPEFVDAFLSLPGSEVDREVSTLLAATLERAIQVHPRYADLHLFCSRIYERLGLHDAARAASERAVEINPRYISAMVQMGRLFESTDRRGEAIERLEEALRMGADEANVHYVLGNLYRAEGQVDRARTSYERALHLNDGFGEARRALETLAA